MYSFEYFNILKKDVKKKIIEERETYRKYYDIIEKFIYDNNLILGGSIAINCLLNRPRGVDDYFYEIYAENGFITANNLANIMDTVNIDHKLFLKTFIMNYKYTIFVNGRSLVNINTVPKMPDINKQLNPVKIKLFGGYEINILSPEIQLLNIYRLLYTPNNSDTWQLNLKDENKLFKYLHKSLNNEVTGSQENNKYKDQLTIINYFVFNNPNIVLIGEFALKIINNFKPNGMVQVISQNIIEEDVKLLEKIFNKIERTTQNINIMHDTRIRRTVFKVNNKEVLYIYNSARYDLIPFNKLIQNNNYVQLANPFVIFRFLLIDFWSVRFMLQIGNIDEKFADFRLKNIRISLLNLRYKMQKDKSIDLNLLEGNGPLVLRIFQSQEKNYIGYYNDEIISQKQLMMLDKKYADYYPSEYKKRNGDYRYL